MDARPRLVLLPGGGSPLTPQARPRPPLRLVRCGPPAELDEALADAVAAARQMRLDIERRIAEALEAFDDR